jgi:hypothetical protein
LETLDRASQPESKSKKQKARSHRIDAPKVVNRLYQAVASPNRVTPPHETLLNGKRRNGRIVWVAVPETEN